MYVMEEKEERQESTLFCMFALEKEGLKIAWLMSKDEQAMQLESLSKSKC